MAGSWSGEVAVVGCGQSDLGTAPLKTPVEHRALAARAALPDCP